MEEADVVEGKEGDGRPLVAGGQGRDTWHIERDLEVTLAALKIAATLIVLAGLAAWLW